MSLMMEYPVITSNLKAGFGAFGTADPFNAALQNNGAQNPVGSLYFQPSPSMGGNTLLSTSVGYCAGLWMRYVLYKSTANPAMVAGPAPVFYTDETYGTVTGRFSEGVIATTGSASSIAGWLLPNTGSVAGVGVGSAITATILNNGGLGSYVWIGLMGFIPSCFLAAGAQTNFIYGATGDFTVAAIADGSAITHRGAGYVAGAVTSNIGDVLATVQPF